MPEQSAYCASRRDEVCGLIIPRLKVAKAVEFGPTALHDGVMSWKGRLAWGTTIHWPSSTLPPTATSVSWGNSRTRFCCVAGDPFVEFFRSGAAVHRLGGRSLAWVAAEQNPGYSHLFECDHFCAVLHRDTVLESVVFEETGSPVLAARVSVVGEWFELDYWGEALKANLEVSFGASTEVDLVGIALRALPCTLRPCASWLAQEDPQCSVRATADGVYIDQPDPPILPYALQVLDQLVGAWPRGYGPREGAVGTGSFARSTC
jgi:hypothetical protein